jgi:chromosome segregation ATPase
MVLHLAQVQKKDTEGKLTLQLLAQQKSDYVWALIPEIEHVLTAEIDGYDEGVLVLVDLSNSRQVKHIQSATRWVLEIVEQFLTKGMTPELLQREVDQAEQWRQTLTLQSQELGRRALEMEARRDQIQELEEKLKQEKKQLEERQEQIQGLEENLKLEKKQLEELEESLKREKSQFELMTDELKANKEKRTRKS